MTGERTCIAPVAVIRGAADVTFKIHSHGKSFRHCKGACLKLDSFTVARDNQLCITCAIFTVSMKLIGS